MKNTCLVIRNHGNIGDLLMITPALKELSKIYIIDLFILKEYNELFYNIDFIRKIYNINKPVNLQRYNKTFNLNDYEFNYEQIYQPNIKKTKQELFAEALNVNLKSLKPIIILDKNELLKIKDIISSKNKKIIIAPKSTNFSREWQLKKWKRLIEKLKKLYYKIIKEYGLFDDPYYRFYVLEVKE
jgi:ADP-heptose:LPS heptosyltransferase